QAERKRAADGGDGEDERVDHHLMKGVILEEIAEVVEPDIKFDRGDHVPAARAEIGAVNDRPKRKDGEKEEVRANEEEKEQRLAARGASFFGRADRGGRQLLEGLRQGNGGDLPSCFVARRAGPSPV